MTTRFRSQCDLWRSIGGKDDEAVARMIRDDRVDIMIYLAGRFDDNRPQIAAWRPAPIQISFLDAATSGLKEMDYLIADPVRVPANPVEKFTERVLRLPNFYVHRPPTEAPAPSSPPGPRMTFGCFNNPAKLNQPVMDLWGKILVRQPDSRLQLRYLQLYTVESFRKSVLADIDPTLHDRVELCGPIYGWANHLRTYNDIDIALDAFPFNGSTTTFEALWMGVPVVTLLGDTLMSRWTASMLTQVGLDDLIAGSPEEYVEIALKLAADRDRLGELRATLRDRLAKSLLCDGARTTRYFERALRAVWRKWCREGEGRSS
jgi:protein O-GlcNAc transferase